MQTCKKANVGKCLLRLPKQILGKPIQNSFAQWARFKFFCKRSYFHLSFLKMLEKIRNDVTHLKSADLFTYFFKLCQKKLKVFSCLNLGQILGKRLPFFVCRRFARLPKNLPNCKSGKMSQFPTSI